MTRLFPNLDEAYNIVITEESQCKYIFVHTNLITQVSAMSLQFVGRKTKPDLVCAFCKKLGHLEKLNVIKLLHIL